MTTTKKLPSSARASVLPRGWRVSVRKAKGADITNYHAFVYGPNDFISYVGPDGNDYWLTRAEAKKHAVEAAIRFQRQNNPILPQTGR